jgi:hypothetical protein
VAITIDQIRAPAMYALTVVRGDSLEFLFRIVSSLTGAPIPLTGWDGYAAVYPSPGSSVVKLELDVDVSQDAAGLAGTGLITVTADAGDTLMVLPGVWRLVLTQGSSSKTIIAGEFCVVEPFAGVAYTSSCGNSACSAMGACSCSSAGSCGYSETLGMDIPCGEPSSIPLIAAAVGEVTIKVGC